MSEKKKALKKIVKFAISSFSSFVVDYIIFTVLMFFLPHSFLWILICNIIARIISSFYNYSVNCRFVFKMPKKMQTGLQYFLLVVIILCINNIVLEFYTQVLNIAVYIAKILTELTLFILSWMVQNKFIFKKNK